MQILIIENERGQRVEFNKFKPWALERIEGIGTPTASHITTKSPNQDGRSIEGTTLEERNPLIYGGIVGTDKDDVDKKRKELNGILNPKLKSRLIYIINDEKYEIDCKVSDVSFQNKVNNIQKFVIELECPNPYWLDKLIKTEIALWVGDFEFPLEIDHTEGIEMGHRVSSLIVNVFNKGDEECGMKIEFKALATVVNPSLFNVNTREYIKINQSLVAGDTLVVETTFANKRIELIRNGVVSNVFYYIDLDSTFLQLDVGDNLFRYDAEQGIDNLEVSIYYRPQYLGV